MNGSGSAPGVWFPQWAEVLSKVRIKDLERRAYRLMQKPGIGVRSPLDG